MTNKMMTLLQAPWLEPTGAHHLKLWKRDLDELSALTGKIDQLLTAWLKHVAPELIWKPEQKSLLAFPGYDGYSPDIDAFITARHQLVMALNEYPRDWKEARISELVNLGLELDAARFRHSQKPTLKGLPDFGKHAKNPARRTTKLR